MDETHCCIVCSAHAPHRCAICQDVRYCSKAHQRSHWAEHKLSCKPFRVEWDVTGDDAIRVNHHLVASMNIEAGNYFNYNI